MAASGTHLKFFSTMFLIPSTLMSRPTISKPASLALTSKTCRGSSTGMWYFFKPANSNCHHNMSEIRRHPLILTPLSSPIRATCPAHLILLHFITRTILGEQYKSFSSSLCSLLHSPRYLVTPRSKYSPQHLVLKRPQPRFLPHCYRPSFTPIQNNR